MNTRSLVAPTRACAAVVALTAAIALLGGAASANAAWQHAHGDSANTGLAKVDTASASYPPQTQPLGPIAPGANPVAGPDGTVYIGNVRGELRAFHPDGAPYWTRQINSTHGGFFAAPVVGDDGSIYIVSSIAYRDHRGGTTTDRHDSFLHKFNPGGAWLFAKAFPERTSAAPAAASRGTTTAPPNIWRFNATEAIIVPVVYRTAGSELRLLAFSTSGDLVADALVPRNSPVTTGGSDFLAECLRKSWWTVLGPVVCAISAPLQEYTGNFDGDPLPIPLDGAGWPLPGVAIRPDPLGSAPLVMVTGVQDKFAYAFSPQSGFSQVARSTHAVRQFTTPPVVLPSGETLTGTRDGYLTRTDRNFAQLPATYFHEHLTAAPTRLADGRLAVVSREGILSVFTGIGRFATRTEIQLSGASIASAAASCKHIFAASADEFATFDAKTLERVASLPWVGGGLHAPIIGPLGHVYAIASDVLFVFPPPWDPYHGTRPPSCVRLLPPVAH